MIELVKDLTVSPHQTPMRLDAWVAHNLGGVSRSRVLRLIREGRVEVNGQKAKPSLAIRPLDQIRVSIPRVIPLDIEPEAIPLDVVFEDSHLIVIDKPAEMVVHPAQGHHSGTIVNALMHHLGERPPGEDDNRPGIVHRLDKDTTGLMILAKTDVAQRVLSAQFRSRLVHRTYHALVWGPLRQEQGTIDAPIGQSHKAGGHQIITPSGRHAVTHYRRIRDFGFLSLVELKLETGRTHQIRVHMHHLNHPLFGDPDYAGRETRARGYLPDVARFAGELLTGFHRQALLARELEFFHPVAGVLMHFSTDYPQDFQWLLEKLEQWQNPGTDPDMS